MTLSTKSGALFLLLATAAHALQFARSQLVPPPPAALAQLARTPASSALLNEFMLHEKQRTSSLAAEFGFHQPAAAAPPPQVARAPPPLTGRQMVQARKAANLAGSLASDTPTYSQATGSALQFRLDSYHSLDEIHLYLNTLAKLHPKRVQLFTIGTTHERRPIWAMELINNSTDPDYVWLDALTHAREWITSTTMLYLIDRLVVGGGVKNGGPIWAKNYIIIPVVNPDGYAFTWSTNRMWRKNRSKSTSALQRSSSATDKSSCIGADLNRNFDHSFGGEGASSDPCSHIYSGAFPFSEPETRALADLMWSLRDRIKFYLTMHSFNQLWACPYAHTTEQTAHLNQHMRVLRTIQQAVYQAEGVHYEIGPLSTSLYVGSGFGIDFAYDKCGIINSYLVELRDKGANGFVLPADQIMPVARETFAGLKSGLRMVFGNSNN